MNTAEFQIRGFGKVTISHNSDWSGLADVRWSGGKGSHGLTGQAKIPGGLLVELGKEAALSSLGDDLIEFIEQWEGQAVPPGLK